MFLAGLITEDGVINGNLRDKTHRLKADGRTFRYMIKEATAYQNEISITQADVRAIQLAKAALYAGTQLLIDKLGKSPDKIILAGAFGSHIDPLYAMLIGLVPDCELHKIIPVGNAAGTGARIALLNKDERLGLNATIHKIHKIETAVEPKFQEHFVNAMAFPHKTASRENLAKLVSLPLPMSPPASAEDGEDGGRRRNRRRG